jgi:hypothetical protein
MEKRNIIWLASYPKSGNTWFRAFLTALMTGKDVDINRLNTGGIYSGRNWIETELDLDIDHLTQEEIEWYQRIGIKSAGDKFEGPTFLKIHDAYTYFPTSGEPRIYSGNTCMAVYLVRNPLDVTLSFANHNGSSVDKILEKFMLNPQAAFLKKNSCFTKQLYQPLGLWTEHVESWKKVEAYPVYFIRYEDMKAAPVDTFYGAVEAMKLNYTREDVAIALDRVAFEKLKKKEEEAGFREKVLPKGVFFHKGEVGRWKSELTAEQVAKIREYNEPMMREFGYW